MTNGCYVMNQWFGITPAAVRSAIAAQRSIIYSFDFYQENDSENKQTLTIDISPKNIQINANGVEGAEDLKVIDWAEQPKVSWTVENVTVTTNGAAATEGFFAPNTVITFTPAQDMVITNIDGQAVNLATFPLTVTQSTNITVLAGTVQQQANSFNAGDNVDGIITADQAAWLNSYIGTYTYEQLAALTGWQDKYLLNVDPFTGSGTLTVTAITVGTDVQVTIALARTEGETAVTGKAIKGVLKLYGTADLGTAFAVLSTATVTDEDFSEGDTTTASFSGNTAKFFKAVIEAPAAE